LSASASFNNQFETVASESRSHVFEPETDRRMTLTAVAARLAAAIGVLALVALFLAIAVPNMSHQKDGPKTALAEFQPFLASVEASQFTTSEPSEKLLRRFIQWRQKSTSTPGP
jgi:p-aminobenzoyl-glutamate transporter AbgT